MTIIKTIIERLQSLKPPTDFDLESSRLKLSDEGHNKKTQPPIIKSLFIVGVVCLGILIGSAVSIYHYQSRSPFIKTISGWIPFPIASIDGDIVTYSRYLAELDRYYHYFKNQHNIDLEEPDQSLNLLDIKQRSLQYAIDQVYINRLAKKMNLKVSPTDIESEFKILNQQHKLLNRHQINQVLFDFFGLSYDQYLERLRDRLIREKVVKEIDDGQTLALAEEIVKKLESGANFAELATKYSDDPASAVNRGRYGLGFDLYQRDEDPRFLKTIFETPVGQVGEIIELGDRVEIIKVLSENNGQRQVAHIQLNLITIEEILAPIKSQYQAEVFIEIK